MSVLGVTDSQTGGWQAGSVLILSIQLSQSCECALWVKEPFSLNSGLDGGDEARYAIVLSILFLHSIDTNCQLQIKQSLQHRVSPTHRIRFNWDSLSRRRCYSDDDELLLYFYRLPAIFSKLEWITFNLKSQVYLIECENDYGGSLSVRIISSSLKHEHPDDDATVAYEKWDILFLVIHLHSVWDHIIPEAIRLLCLRW